MSDLLIKPMQGQSETEKKGYVHFQSWQETYAGLVDLEYLSHRVTLEKCVDIARKWPDNLLVVKADGRVIGFAGYGPYRNESLPGCGEVYSLYVLRQYHGKKAGFALMNAALEQLAAYGKIALWVLRGNERAIRFYERYGFRFDGTEQKILLGTPNTELRMIYERKIMTTR